MTWQPDDRELDAAARALPPPPGDPARAEEVRTALLAAAARQVQLPRRTWVPVAALGVALAAAASIAIWLAVRPIEPGLPRIATTGSGSFARLVDWPAYTLWLDEGRIELDVATRDETARVLTRDGEVAIRRSHVAIAASHGRLSEVAVREGSVELRAEQHVIVLHAGETWTATQLAQREVIVPTPTPAPAHEPIAEPHPARRPAPPRPAKALAPEVVPPASPPPADPATPGAADFRAGWTALRAGDASGAAKRFALACTAAAAAPLGEDACFWAGAAAQRANDPATARPALAGFLARFPGSPRAPEASALLGWILYAGGDLDAAATRFHAAEHDRVPQVRASAQKGLEAIARSRPK